MHSFSPTSPASFTTTTLSGFIFSYADGAGFYTGTVAGPVSIPASSLGTYTVFADGVTGLAPGMVTVDRFTAAGVPYIPSGGGSGGLGSETGLFTANGSVFSFGNNREPHVPSPIIPAAAAPSTGNVNADLVTEVYNELLNRSPTTPELQSGIAALGGGTPLATIRTSLSQSTELQNDVNNLYSQLLGRPASSGDLAGATALLTDGASLASLELSLAQSPEAQAAVTTIYQQVLNLSDFGDIFAGVAALGQGASLAGLRGGLAHSSSAQSDLTALFQAIVIRAPSTAELAGMEDRLATPGISQQTLQSLLSTTGSAGGFTTIVAPAFDTTLSAPSGTPTMFDFRNLGFTADTVTGFDVTRDTVELPSALAASLSITGTTDTVVSVSGHTVMLAGVAPGSVSQPGNILFG